MDQIKTNTIGVCMGIACRAKGSEDIFELIRETLGIGVGETTPDGKFSIIPVRCLGDCVNAPIVIFNGDALLKQNVDNIREILTRRI